MLTRSPSDSVANAQRTAEPDGCCADSPETKTEAPEIPTQQPTPKAALVTRLRVRVREWQPRFLEMLRTTANVKLSCAAAGISRMTAYRERDKNVEFAKAFDEAMQDAVDLLHKAAFDRAAKGYLRPFYQCGVLVGHETNYSDRLLMLLLRAHRPEMFNPNKPPPMKLAVPVKTCTPEEVLATLKRITPLIRNRAAADG